MPRRAPNAAIDVDEVREALTLLIELAFCFERSRSRDDEHALADLRRLLDATAGMRQRKRIAERDAFVMQLHRDLTAIYREVQKTPDRDIEIVEDEIIQLFAKHGVRLSNDQIGTLALDADEIKEMRGPSDAAREALQRAQALPVRMRATQSAKDRALGRLVANGPQPSAFGIAPSGIALTRYVLQLLGWSKDDIEALIERARSRARGTRVEGGPPSAAKTKDTVARTALSTRRLGSTSSPSPRRMRGKPRPEARRKK